MNILPEQKNFISYNTYFSLLQYLTKIKQRNEKYELHCTVVWRVLREFIYRADCYLQCYCWSLLNLVTLLVPWAACALFACLLQQSGSRSHDDNKEWQRMAGCTPSI
jgi:hypothetical protein